MTTLTHEDISKSKYPRFETLIWLFSYERQRDQAGNLYPANILSLSLWSEHEPTLNELRDAIASSAGDTHYLGRMFTVDAFEFVAA